MSNRIKHTTPVINSRAEAETALGEIAKLTVRKRKVQNDMDKEIVRITQENEPSLTALDKDIKTQTQLVEAWAAAHPEEFPKDRKSIDMAQGTIGYRTGMPKLTLRKGQKWDVVLEILKSLFGGSYVRTKEDVAKDEILNAYASGSLNDAQLGQLRVNVTQDEDFFIKLELSEPA
jgi:phage host-nuclease inhibitor protein Gam